MIRRPPRSTLFPYTTPSDLELQSTPAHFLGSFLPPASPEVTEESELNLWIRDSARFSMKFEVARSEEHTSELQSQSNLVCRLLLEKKKTQLHNQASITSQYK